MQQVLFTIPVLGIPIFGYGACLVLAIYLCTWLARRMAAGDGLNPDLMEDLVWWVVLPGIVGGRLLFIVQDPITRARFADHPFDVIKIWEGGLVLYGAGIGALLGLLAFCQLRKLAPLRVLDLIAPSIAVGIAIGRVGCFLNGCCHGGYCDLPVAVRFPGGSGPALQSTGQGLMSRFGFSVDPDTRRVLFVEPGTPAAQLGLEPSDIIVSLEGTAILSSDDLDEHWPELGKRTHQPVTLGVRGKAGDRSLTIPPAASPPLHPTQLYSAVDGLILCLFLLAVRGTRPPAGTVTAWLAVIYSVSRFLIEGIRSDERPAVGGLSISQVISLVLFGAGLLLLALAWMPTRTRTT